MTDAETEDQDEEREEEKHEYEIVEQDQMAGGINTADGMETQLVLSIPVDLPELDRQIKRHSLERRKNASLSIGSTTVLLLSDVPGKYLKEHDRSRSLV